MRFQFPSSRGLAMDHLRSRSSPILSARAKPAPKPKNPIEVAGSAIGGALAASKNFWIAAVAGGFAGTCMFPVDTAKVRMQACAQSEQAIAAAARTYRTTFQTMGKVAADEGVLSLYKGLLPVIIGSAPEMAVQVAAYEWARDELAAKFKKSKLDADVLFAAGCFSGLAHCLASNPMEVLKIRGQVLGAASGGIVGAIKEIGIPGLYKGVIACWARDIPFSAIYFPTYAITKNKLEEKGVNGFASAMGAGLVAGVVAAAPTTPCDVVKTRLQNPKVGGTVYKGALDCIGQMMTKEGPGSFFTGVVPRVGRVAPYLALSLTSYELIKTGVSIVETKYKAGTLFPKKADAKGKKGKK